MPQHNLQKERENLAHNLVYLRTQFKIPKYRMAQLLRISLYSLRKLEAQELPPRLSVEILFDLQDCFHIPIWRILSCRLEEMGDLPVDKMPAIPTEHSPGNGRRFEK